MSSALAADPFAPEALRAAILSALSPDVMRDIAQAMADKAMRGCVAAARLLWQYTLGKPPASPVQSVNPTLLNALLDTMAESVAQADAATPSANGSNGPPAQKLATAVPNREPNRRERRAARKRARLAAKAGR